MMGLPRKFTCKMCGKKEKNDTRKSHIVLVTCSECRRAMFSAKTLRAQARKVKNVQTIEVKENKPTEKESESVKITTQRKGYITLSSFTT
tara:strand:+ start:1009 stop:1278 length:270 start_codon:yes stop_codon:yes gene_type:complete